MEHTIPYQGVERRRVAWPGLQRVRWGAVFAGLFFTVVTQMLLTILGLAIGFTAVDPRQGAPGEAFGWGAAVWAVLTLVVSLFIGAYMTGRLSNVSNRSDGAVNGALTWAVSLVVMMYLVGSGAAALTSGAFGLLGSAANTAAMVAGQSNGGGSDVVDRAKDAARSAGIDIDAAKQRAQGAAQDAQNTAQRATEPGTPENAQAKETAAKATDYAATGAWSLLVAALVGLAIAAWAGSMGAAADMRRIALRSGRTTAPAA